jgi:hypothetical protein
VWNTEFEYEPTDIEDELFLSEVPLNLLEKAIESQFQDPLEYRKKDYIQTFITKYDFSKENLYEEEQENLEQMHDQFIKFIINIFDTYLSIGFPDIEDAEDDDQHELILLTYRFFIKNIKKNFVTLIINYINEHKEELVDEEIAPKKRDVTTLNFKVEINDENDVIILSNLGSVIRYILSQELTVDDFFELIKSDSNCLETEFVEEKFDEFLITGNFIQDYIKMIDENFFVELESKIRNKILKNYPKRKKNNEENNIETTDE